MAMLINETQRVTVLVFRTSVHSPDDVISLQSTLNLLIEPGGKWSFDLEDCDRVLRVETNSVSPEDIVEVLATAGYWCLEME